MTERYVWTGQGCAVSADPLADLITALDDLRGEWRRAAARSVDLTCDTATQLAVLAGVGRVLHHYDRVQDAARREREGVQRGS